MFLAGNVNIASFYIGARYPIDSKIELFTCVHAICVPRKSRLNAWVTLTDVT